jgi:hypothetical protein
MTHTTERRRLGVTPRPTQARRRRRLSADRMHALTAAVVRERDSLPRRRPTLARPDGEIGGVS